MSAHPYRTAPVAAEPQHPWWRRALCAIGSHSLYLAGDRLARCEHCNHETDFLLGIGEYFDALDAAVARCNDGESAPDEEAYLRSLAAGYPGVVRRLVLR